MEIEEVDVLIVGAGPAGASTALNLARLDPSHALRTVVLEKAVHPRDKLCGGGVTHMGEMVLNRMGLEFEPPHVAIREARIEHWGRPPRIRGNPVFRIAHRRVFDHWLVEKVQQAGIPVRQSERVLRLDRHVDHVEVETDRTRYRARVVVGADGSNSTVRRLLGWRDGRIARLLEVLTPVEPGAESLMRDGVAVFDHRYVTGGMPGYYWDFPSVVDGVPMMNRGVFDSRSQRAGGVPLKEALRRALADRGHDLEQLELKGHPLRIFDPAGQIATERILLAGDAAGADPLLGEGISFALAYGEVVAAATIDAFHRQCFDFSSYQAEVLRHPLLSQLRKRIRSAGMGERFPSPRFSWFFYSALRLILRFTRWNDPDQVPASRDHRVFGA